MGHTPGPWYVGQYGDNDSDVCAEGGPVICALRSGNADPYDMTAAADARLIAAAPEMLKQLRAVRDDIGALALDTNGWREWDATAVDELLGSRLVRLDDLIAKAEGRE
jgi:hypothetical protein